MHQFQYRPNRAKRHSVMVRLQSRVRHGFGKSLLDTVLLDTDICYCDLKSRDGECREQTDPTGSWAKALKVCPLLHLAPCRFFCFACALAPESQNEMVFFMSRTAACAPLPQCDAGGPAPLALAKDSRSLGRSGSLGPLLTPHSHSHTQHPRPLQVEVDRV